MFIHKFIVEESSVYVEKSIKIVIITSGTIVVSAITLLAITLWRV